MITLTEASVVAPIIVVILQGLKRWFGDVIGNSSWLIALLLGIACVAGLAYGDLPFYTIVIYGLQVGAAAIGVFEASSRTMKTTTNMVDILKNK